MRFLAVLCVIFAGLMLIPQSRAAILTVWDRFQAGGNLSAVIVTVAVVFTIGVLVASQDRV